MKYLTPIVSLFVAVLMMAALAPEANAQDTQATEVKDPDIILQVKGMVCELCVYNMEKHLKGIDAVNNVQVKLDEQKVFLTLHDDQTATEDALRKAVTSAGFTTEGVTFTKKDNTSKADPPQER